jgi:hypothetical protein
MKNFIVFVIGALFIAFSCQKNSVEGTVYDEDVVLEKSIFNFNHNRVGDMSIPDAKKPNGKAVTKTIIFHNSSGYGSVIVNPEECGDFSPPLQLIIDGGGTATHLGLYTVINKVCIDIDGNFLSPVLGFMTAANGDEIHSIMGNPYPDMDNPPNVYFPYTIIGGTGRFDGASGHIDMYGIAKLEPPFDWHLTGIGEITY